MAFLYERERDANELTAEVRAYLYAIGDGKSESEAAALACIDLEDLRRWKRDPVFRSAVKRAKREGPRTPHVWAGPISSPGAPPPGTPEAQIEREGWAAWHRSWR